MKNILFFDHASKEVKTAQHVMFDKGFNSETDVPSNVQMLRMHNSKLQPSLSPSNPTLDIDIQTTPFTELVKVTLSLIPTNEFPLGLDFQRCTHMLRAYIADIDRHVRARSFSPRTFCKRFLGSYVLALNGHTIFTTQDILNELDHLASLPEPPSDVVLTLAPDR